MKVIKKFIILLVINPIMSQEMPLDLKIQQLPKELQKHIFSAQNVRSLSTYEAWRMLGAFDKLVINQAYDAQDKKFIEDIVTQVHRAYYYSFLGRYSHRTLSFPEFEPFQNGITGLLTVSKFQKKTKELYTTIIYNGPELWSPLNELTPEQLLASIINVLFRKLNTLCRTRNVCWRTSAKTWKQFVYLFEIRALLKKMNLLDPMFDINSYRDLYCQLHQDYGAPRMNREYNYLCAIQ